MRRYQQEEGGGVDETHDPFVGDDALFEKRATEMQKKVQRRDGSTMSLAQVCCQSPCTGKSLPQAHCNSGACILLWSRSVVLGMHVPKKIVHVSCCFQGTE